ncbi:TetR/AcrR family transcriptional regulator [Paenibacillus sambharensis]|uniref:TetR/AcrR family transcriptional regulator n=1 Tax=Paenibacillus sambharensis TaxID=1803190 RepID=A0A2W1LV76_9BACL|nr:TetR/AcrR family transcriptional regulator [Paenibacillus sambharensis]PZD95407.1 TetR/AcrR family transcriptional regulator [Paenibacillus sambharensis]
MRKGDKTRQYIITKSAELFNQRGYAGASIADIIEKTGIKKGGIYRHFTNKDELAAESFNYAASTVGRLFTEAMEQHHTAKSKLLAFLRVYDKVAEHPPFVGGCPLLNTAVESDDSHPVLRSQAVKALEDSLIMLKSVIEDGIRRGEFKAGVDAGALANFTLAILEGSIMMSKLEGDNRYILQNIESFTVYLDQCCLEP